MPKHSLSTYTAVFLFLVCGANALAAQECPGGIRLKSKTESRFPGHAVLMYENDSDTTIRIRLIGTNQEETGEAFYSSTSLAAHGVTTMNLLPDNYAIAWFPEERGMQADEQEDENVLLMGSVAKLYMASTLFPEVDSDAKQNLQFEVKPNSKTLFRFESCDVQLGKSNTPATLQSSGVQEEENPSEAGDAKAHSEFPSPDRVPVSVPQPHKQSLSPIRDCSAISSRDTDLAPLSSVCEFLRKMDHALPNFTCEQTTQRYIPVDPGPHVPIVRPSDGAIQDTISATVTYENGSNEYSDVKIANGPAHGSLLDLTGPIVTGDFGSGLLSLFREENAAAFSFRESSDGPQGRDYVFDFRIPARKNHIFTYYENGAETRPDVTGALFVNTNTGEVREMSLLATPINSSFSADHVRFDTKFGRVQFGEAGEFLLPTQSESVVCTRRGLCTRNVTRWTNCRRLAAKSRILLGTN